MTQAIISVSVPATRTHLAAAIAFLTQCQKLDDPQSIYHRHAETIVALSSVPESYSDNDLEIPEEVLQVHSPEPVPAPAPVPTPTPPVPAPAPVPVPAPAPVIPVFELTDKAGEFTLDDFYKQGWTKEGLLNDGYLIEVKPAAPAPAPSPAVATTATNAPTAPAHFGAVEVDAQGVPHDPDIHSSGKTKYSQGTGAGTWVKKRGVDEALYARRTAELLAIANADIRGTAYAAPTPPVPAPAPAPAPTGSIAPGAQLIRDFNAAMKENPAIDQVAFLKAVQNAGMAAIKDVTLPQNAHLLPSVRQELFGG